jgi:hypothetical protein
MISAQVLHGLSLVLRGRRQMHALRTRDSSVCPCRPQKSCSTPRVSCSGSLPYDDLRRVGACLRPRSWRGVEPPHGGRRRSTRRGDPRETVPRTGIELGGGRRPRSRVGVRAKPSALPFSRSGFTDRTAIRSLFALRARRTEVVFCRPARTPILPLSSQTRSRCVDSPCGSGPGVEHRRDVPDALTAPADHHARAAGHASSFGTRT